MHALVTRNHIPAHAAPIAVKCGDQVRIEPRESEWPGWVWCVAASGKSGWVPEAILARNNGAAEILRDYNAVEFHIVAGDHVQVIETESGWCLCRTENGEIGWIPANTLGEDRR